MDEFGFFWIGIWVRGRMNGAMSVGDALEHLHRPLQVPVPGAEVPAQRGVVREPLQRRGRQERGVLPRALVEQRAKLPQPLVLVRGELAVEDALAPAWGERRGGRSERAVGGLILGPDLHGGVKVVLLVILVTVMRGYWEGEGG